MLPLIHKLVMKDREPYVAGENCGTIKGPFDRDYYTDDPMPWHYLVNDKIIVTTDQVVEAQRA